MSKNVKSTASLALPQGPPHVSVRDYFVSKRGNELMKFVPECEPVGRRPGLITWRAHRDLTTAREQYEDAKLKYSTNRERMDNDWKKLESHQLMLRHAFEQFNDFVHENEDKRERAAHKINANNRALKQRDYDVESLREDKVELGSIVDEMEKQLDNYKHYEKYLSSVVAESNEFSTPMDVINRYEALVSTKYKLSEKQKETLFKLNELSNDMAKLFKDKKIQIVGMSNKLSSLRMRHERARNEAKKLEVVLNKIKKETANRQSDLFRVRESLWALYQKICKNKGIPVTCKKQDYESQLVLVMRGLMEIRKIVKLAQENTVRDLASDRAQASGE